MEDMYAKHKKRMEQIRVSSPYSGFLIEPDFSMDKIKRIPLKTRRLKMAKRVLLVFSVMMIYLAVLIGGSILVGTYLPEFVGYWWLFSFLLGWVCADISFS